MTDATPPARPAAYDKKVGLVLQGGGALGSYQAGVYEALASSEYLPDWVAGISIGAINAAIIAGNAPGDRVGRLREFWEGVTAPTRHWPSALGGPLAAWRQRASAFTSLMFGQPGFFAPRTPQEWLSPHTLVSYYDTAALKGTLERLVDFDRVNDPRQMRVSVGAVNVRTGHFAYFDSERQTIRAEHVMASGALPPGFPPVEVDGEHYWDGGLFSNTPLQYMIDYSPRRSRLIFQVDVFAAYGQVPRNLDEVDERAKDIRYSSRTKTATQMLSEKHEVRHAINELYRAAAAEAREYRAGAAPLRIRLRHRDGYRAADLPPVRAARIAEGLRVQPRHDGGALATGPRRRAHQPGRLALARADAEGPRRARVRRRARHVGREAQVAGRRKAHRGRSLVGGKGISQCSECTATPLTGLLRFARNDGASVIARSVSDEAIQKRHCRLDCFAALAMTALRHCEERQLRSNPETALQTGFALA